MMAGFVCTKTPELSKQIYFHQNAEGTGLAPFDCWLVLRGSPPNCAATPSCPGFSCEFHPSVFYSGAVPLHT